MEFKDINIQELNLQELITIDGGDEHTDSVWYGIGCFFAFFRDNAGTIRPSEYR